MTGSRVVDMVGKSRAAVERAVGVTESSAGINRIEVPVHERLIPCPRAISKKRISNHVNPSLLEGVPVSNMP